MQVSIVLDPSIIVDKEGATHTHTTWQVATYPNFAGRFFIKDESLYDQTNLTSFTANVADVKDNRVYYRAKFYYSDKSSSDWTRIIEVIADEQQPLPIKIMMRTPTLNGVFDYSQNIAGELVIHSNEPHFFIGTGTHMSSDWKVVDENEAPIRVSPADTINLTDIRFSGDGIKDNSVYALSVKYNAENDISSDDGVVIFNTMVDSGNYFDMVATSGYLVDLPIYFGMTLKTTQFKAVELKVTDINNVIIAQSAVQESLTPWIVVANSYAGTRYVLSARLTLKNGTTTPWSIIHSGTLGKNYLFEIDTNVVYLEAFDYLQELSLKGLTTHAGYQLVDGSVLLGKVNDNNIYRYAIEDGVLVEKNIAYTLPVEDNITIPYFNILPLYNGNILINYASNTAAATDQRSVFKLFKYNTTTKLLTLLDSIKNETEWLSTAISNSMFTTRDHMVYYVPAREVDENENYVELKLHILNTDSFNTQTRTLPFSAKSFVSMAPVSETEFIVFGGAQEPTLINNEYIWERSNNDVYLYDTVTSQFTLITTIPNTVPVSMYNFQSYLRKDGKVILFNSVRNGDSLPDQRTIIYDVGLKTFTFKNNDLPDGLSYRTSVYLRDGDILRITGNIKDAQVVYRYICNSKTLNQITTRTIVDAVIKALVVNDGETIDIEDITELTKVDILGTGKLNWHTDDVVKVFDKNTLILTHDRVMTINEYTAAQYSNIFVINNAVLTLEP